MSARTQRSSGLISVTSVWPGVHHFAFARRLHVDDAVDRREDLRESEAHVGLVALRADGGELMLRGLHLASAHRDLFGIRAHERRPRRGPNRPARAIDSMRACAASYAVRASSIACAGASCCLNNSRVRSSVTLARSTSAAAADPLRFGGRDRGFGLLDLIGELPLLRAAARLRFREPATRCLRRCARNTRARPGARPDRSPRPPGPS